MKEAIHIVCPHCEALNRVLSIRLDDGPKCGKCHQPLFEGRPAELTTSNFKKHINQNDIPLLVDFWAPWCGPCKKMAPQFAQAAIQLEPKVRLAKVNTDVEQSLGTRFAVRSIPTLILFQHGREAARQSGAMGATDIVQWVLGKLPRTPSNH